MPFNSYEFREFCSNITTTSPHYPQENGFAERAVGIAKNLLKKTSSCNEDLWLALLEYINTPLKDVNASPTELLMSRKTRSLVLAKTELLHPKIIPNVSQKLEKKQATSQRYYNRHAIYKSNFTEGEKVWYHEKNGWVEAVINEALSSPRSYIIQTDDGTTLRRNSRWIRKRT
ncbi:uncharacterized protein [Musca autumnalis]|uniref:uncharacterized protein n=1 Tax=Musca autumnalis TaxID=221902 RepID=UPI003CEA62FE